MLWSILLLKSHESVTLQYNHLTIVWTVKTSTMSYTSCFFKRITHIYLYQKVSLFSSCFSSIFFLSDHRAPESSEVFHFFSSQPLLLGILQRVVGLIWATVKRGNEERRGKKKQKRMEKYEREWVEMKPTRDERLRWEEHRVWLLQRLERWWRGRRGCGRERWKGCGRESAREREWEKKNYREEKKEVGVKWWKDEPTGREREGSWWWVGNEWKTWSQLIAPSFHGNSRPFPPTLSLTLVSFSFLCLIHSLTSFTLHFLFVCVTVSIITLRPRFLWLANPPFFCPPSSPLANFPFLFFPICRLSSSWNSSLASASASAKFGAGYISVFC